MKDEGFPDLNHYNVPTVFNAFSAHADELNHLYDALSIVDNRYRREGTSFHDIFDNLRWDPIDSFRLQCLDISWRIMDERDRFEEYVLFFVETYLDILRAEKHEEFATKEEIVKFYQKFMEAFFRGLGCYESEILLRSHCLHCFQHFLQHLVEYELTVKRSLLDIDLIHEVEYRTKGYLQMMLHEKSFNELFSTLSVLPIEFQKPEVLYIIKKLVEEEFLNNLGKPSINVSLTELAVIACCFCKSFKELAPKNGSVNWKLFEDYWGVKDLRQALEKQKWIDPNKRNSNINRIEKIFGLKNIF